jgi:hypothetical protein
MVVVPTPMSVTAPVAVLTVATAGFELAYTIGADEVVVAVGPTNAVPHTTFLAVPSRVTTAEAFEMVIVRIDDDIDW